VAESIANQRRAGDRHGAEEAFSVAAWSEFAMADSHGT
jgi:hypothetical protein